MRKRDVFRGVGSQPRRRVDRAGFALWAFAALVFLFLFAPIVIIVVTSFTTSSSVEFPPTGFSLVWHERFVATFRGAPGTRPGLARAVWFSTSLALLTACLAGIGGLLAAYAFHKFPFRGRSALQSLFLLPVTFPSLVIGVGLLLTFSELRLFDRFTRLLIGHVVVALPYVILTIGASLKVYEEEVEEAARTLGANSLQTFGHITLPLIRPGIAAGAIFGFIISFTNFTVSFFLSTGSAKSVPIWIFEFIQAGHDPLLAAISVFLVALAVVVLVLLQRLIGIQRIVGVSG